MDQNNNNRGPDSSSARGNLDPKRLSFSQAQDYECVPAPLKLEELPKSARTQIWNLIYFHLEQSIRRGVHTSTVSGSWEKILERMHGFFDNLARDDWTADFDSNRRTLREHIEGDRFNKVFDRLEFIMRDRECPYTFIRDLNTVFEMCGLAYTIDRSPPPNILPVATPQERRALVESLHDLRRAGLSGSTAHLEAASACINRRDWSGAVRESIHAVESVARKIDPQASRTLAPALASIEKRDALHPALKDAFKKLYGYASDEQGIRHALLDHPTAKVGMDEAVFMLSACASFASYLWRKHAA